MNAKSTCLEAHCKCPIMQVTYQKLYKSYLRDARVDDADEVMNTLQTKFRNAGAKASQPCRSRRPPLWAGPH